MHVVKSSNCVLNFFEPDARSCVGGTISDVLDVKCLPSAFLSHAPMALLSSPYYVDAIVRCSKSRNIPTTSVSASSAVNISILALSW